MTDHNIPEYRYHQRKQESLMNTASRIKTKHTSIITRFRMYWSWTYLHDPPVKSFMFRHSQRAHVAPFWFCGLFFFFLGTLANYANYKRNVVEDKWVEKYGQDVPHFRKLWLAHKV